MTGRNITVAQEHHCCWLGPDGFVDGHTFHSPYVTGDRAAADSLEEGHAVLIGIGLAATALGTLPTVIERFRGLQNGTRRRPGLPRSAPT